MYRWWRSLCSLGLSMLQISSCTLLQICAFIQSCLEGLQTIPWILWLGLCSDIDCQRILDVFVSKSRPINWTCHRWRSKKWSVGTGCTRAQLYLSRQRLLSYFCFSIFNKLARISSQHFYFIFFYISSLWGVVCRTLRWKIHLTHCGVRL